MHLKIQEHLTLSSCILVARAAAWLSSSLYSWGVLLLYFSSVQSVLLHASGAPESRSPAPTSLQSPQTTINPNFLHENWRDFLNSNSQFSKFS